MKKSLLLVLGAVSLQAHAHYGLLECWYTNERSNLLCEASWSDGSDATNYDIQLYSYDDDLLARATTDSSAQVTFPVPEDEFYVVFDPGHEAAAEVDIVEVKDK